MTSIPDSRLLGAILAVDYGFPDAALIVRVCCAECGAAGIPVHANYCPACSATHGWAQAYIADPRARLIR